MDNSDPQVLIIGAGISGLVLAQHLQRLGVRFEIFDRDSALDARNGGWGLTLHWALPILRDLLPAHLVDKFPGTFVNKDASSRGDVGSFQFFNLKSGEALYSIPAQERIRVNRGRLRELLTSGINVHVGRYLEVQSSTTRLLLTSSQWDKTLLNIESSVESITAYFDDGTSYTGRLLVACDGARSRARQILYPNDCQMNALPVQLLGASPLYKPEEMGGAQSIDPYIFQGSHPETDIFMFFSCWSLPLPVLCSVANFIVLDTPSNYEESSRDQYHCQIIVSWADSKDITLPSDNSDRVALMKKLTDNWAEPFRSLVQNLPEDIEARSIRVEDWLFQPGRTNVHARAVTLGDAAHTMTMFRGEGANNAIYDVLDLVKRVDMRNSNRSFEFEALSTSLAAFEKDIFARVEPSVLKSRQACLDAHQFSKIAGSPLVTERKIQVTQETRAETEP
ncbi:hypothetical protein N7448_005856 [Penicillium atrosanguineum]|uniref:FAD-binding domain-containing protein n=1 Tax=Penicillium atrosanguineum TaxID=1132637 RepID=A0A9W9GXD5_9EURO|nr:hypothetical protein N7448_005856 [Penicillium atrosanguineum]KAJ5307181.1 hypothetical protein N7476_007837 [Penicillium atrosanguineum]